MKTDDIKTLRTGIADILEEDVDAIEDNVHLNKDLGADSFALLEIMYFVERTFNAGIPPECMPRMTTLNKIIRLIDENARTA